MKKFRTLKQSIIDSKDGPVLLETCMGKIRSSYYKLSFAGSEPSSSATQTKNISNASSAQCTQKIAIPLQQDPENGATANKYSKQREDIQDRHGEADIVFNQIESSCRKSARGLTSQAEIFESILDQLDLLERQKSFHEPINLIKRIISTIQTQKNFNGLSQDTTPPKPRYQQTKICTGNKSDLRTCVEIDFDQDEELFKGILEVQRKIDQKKCGNRQIKTEKDEDRSLFADEGHFKSQEAQSNIKKQLQFQPKDIKYKILLPGEELFEDYIDIDTAEDIEDVQWKCSPKIISETYQQSQDSEINLEYSEDLFEAKSLSEQSEILNNTMKSQDLDQWNAIGQQQQLPSLEDVSEESIQCRKIRYILESGSTNKKNKKAALKGKPKKLSIQIEMETTEQTRNPETHQKRKNHKSEAQFKAFVGDNKLQKRESFKNKDIRSYLDLLKNKYSREVVIRPL